MLFTKELARRGEGSGVSENCLGPSAQQNWTWFQVTVYSLHPGVIATDLARHVRDTFGPIGSCMAAVSKPFIRWITSHSLKYLSISTPWETFLHHVLDCVHIRTVESGAQTTIYCAVDEKIADHNGRSVFGLFIILMCP